MKKEDIITGVKRLITRCENIINNPEFFDDDEIDDTRKTLYYLTHLLFVVQSQDRKIENLKTEITLLKNITKTYDAVKFDEPFIKNAKIVIADKEFFDKGCFNVNLISKKDIQKKIDNLHFLKHIDKTDFKINYEIEDLFNFAIEQLEELL